MLLPTSVLSTVIGVAYPSSGEGNTNSIAPFSYTPNVRYQQVYEAFRFQPGTLRLDSIALRLDTPQGRPSSGTYTNVQIRMSTTSASESSLSPVFANNVGSDATVIFSGTLTWSSPHTSGEPQPWELVLTPTSPFIYDRARGNLLLDYQGDLSVNGLGPLDAWRVVGDGTASVFAVPDAAMGTVDTIGLTTLLSFTLIPEPSTYLLLFVGGGILWLIHNQSRERKDVAHTGIVGFRVPRGARNARNEYEV